ncbi:hypothetical protein [Nostoc sp.]|uniref:hypothetical protein n=1 Tax=Nostoc sp. TaxID=1180 RepID=UPI002FFAF31F
MTKLCHCDRVCLKGICSDSLRLGLVEKQSQTLVLRSNCVIPILCRDAPNYFREALCCPLAAKAWIKNFYKCLVDLIEKRSLH